MGKSFKTWITIAGAVASIVLLFAAIFSPEKERERVEGPLSTHFIPWQDKSVHEEEQVVEREEPVIVPDVRGRWIRFVDPDGRGPSGELMIGAPGMYPPVRQEALSGYVDLPVHEARRMDGVALPHYEVIFRHSEDGDDGDGVGFWGVVRSPEAEIEARIARTISMSRARALDIEVVDQDGEPLEGVFLRLSRDSVGLLHLHYTTEEDGKARFRAIPPGVYFLTLDADNFSRQVLRLEHSKDADSPYIVPLEEGGGLRLPESWRGPPVEVMAQGPSSSAPASGGANENGEEESTSANAEVTLEVYAADYRGSGVEGAWIEAWQGGRRVAEGASLGRQPLRMSVLPGEPVHLVATHAGWGEGTLVVHEVGGRGDRVITLSEGLFSSSIAGDRIRRVHEVEEILRAPLVSDNGRWLIDFPDDDSPLLEAQGERGDSLLFLRRQGNSYLAKVERRGRLIALRF